MGETLSGSAAIGLERSCEPGGQGLSAGDWVRARPALDGIEAVQARFDGAPFGRHRHDTYAIGQTVSGVQAFTYRGAGRACLAGQVHVLHPDEMHDGRAGTEEGFAYRILYIEPARIAEAVEALAGGPRSLPFLPSPVSRNPALVGAIDAAFRDPAEPLAVDATLLELARGLLAEEKAGGRRATPRLDRPALDRARAFLDAERHRVVRSDELEAVTGLGRFELARQFRARFGTSPYRYLLMRRLDRARVALAEATVDLAALAQDLGFADQAHLTRVFKAATGLTPGRYRALVSAAA